jgi:alkylation response protein AidB-like acyl-CoA dehydrogenase
MSVLERIASTRSDESHKLFAATAARFVEREMVPHRERWTEAGVVDRDVWQKAGALGLICPFVGEEDGGPGGDSLHALALVEALGAAALPFGGFSIQDIVAKYLVRYGSVEQRRRWLPPLCSGEIVTAIAMTEPGAGSDVQAIRTSARRDGDAYVVDGQKTFITNSVACDLILAAVKTDPSQGARGISLLLIEADREGVRKGRNLAKIGQHLQDTGELFFENVRVPAENLLGEEGRGFAYLMSDLPYERLTIGLTAVASAETALAWTIAYVKEREAFGKPLIAQQHVAFELAEMKTELRIGRVFVADCVERFVAGGLDNETAAMCKYWLTELHCRVVDRCLQLHGGYGYMEEYPIARAFVDARVGRIYGGSNEIMRQVIARTL